MNKNKKYKAIVIGSSAGGLEAITKLLGNLPKEFSLPVIIVQHRSKDQKHILEDVLLYKCKLNVKQADEKEKIESGIIYIAPPDYHLLIENDHTFSLSSDEAVQYSRPSIDVLFESAALVFKDELIGIILTGANKDGANGVSMISESGGLTIAQDPVEARYPAMPEASIATKKVDFIWTLNEIRKFLMDLFSEYEKNK